MNTKDGIHVDDPVSDEQFDAFLAGEDGLSAMLRALPQPRPSAALDAAILAQARAAHGLGQAAAANDPAQDGRATPHLSPSPSPSPRRAFFSRWKIPLGLAASLLLIAPIMWHLRPQPQDAQVVLARAEPTAAAAAAPAAMAAAPVADMAVANPPVQVAENVASLAKDSHGQPQKAKRAMDALEKTVLAKAEQAQAGQPAKEQAMGAATGRLDDPKSVRDAAPGDADHPNPWPTQAPIVVAAAPPAPVAAAPAMSRAPTDDAEPGGPRVVAKKAAKRAEIAAPEPDIAATSGKADNAGDASPAMEEAQAAEPQAGAANEKAKAWLGKIDELIKSKQNQRALDEWAKFRRDYPAYKVPPQLLQTIQRISVIK